VSDGFLASLEGTNTEVFVADNGDEA
jgi:hypothetical protein